MEKVRFASEAFFMKFVTRSAGFMSLIVCKVSPADSNGLLFCRVCAEP